jgi:hypothetical protein
MTLVKYMIIYRLLIHLLQKLLIEDLSNKINPADRYAPADFFVRQPVVRTKVRRCA